MSDSWTENDLKDLGDAVKFTEEVSFVARLGDLVGRPIEKIFKILPAGASKKVSSAVEASLRKSLGVAVSTMDTTARSKAASNLAHKTAVGTSGAVGGVFGLPALGIELPISTTIMLRSIADIARSEGEDLASLSVRLECLSVFALGGQSEQDDTAESGYFAARAGLAIALQNAAQHIAKRGLADAAAPPIVRLISQIAARFSGVVGEKIAAGGVPLLGAIGGATINVLFMDHFQDVAKGHFIVRRLERKHGTDEVKQRYEAIRAGEDP